MAKTEHYYTPFEPDCFYHIYNRTVDLKPLFAKNENYHYFLKRYNDYLSGVVDTYAYCLLGNHFHLLVRVKSQSDLSTFQNLSNIKAEKAHDIVSHQYQKFFQSYAMAFNKQQNRIGTLFQTPFKRAKISTNDYLIKCVHYIHFNPQKHGLIKDFKDYPWSSYQSYLSQKPTKLRRDDAIEWFEDLIGFLQQHKLMPEDKQESWLIED
jgi:putative transposase